MVNQDEIIAYIASTFAHVDVLRPDEGPGAGDTFFILENDARQFPFATMVVKDYGEFDNRSRLDREGVFRLNVGVSRETFRSLFPGDVEHDYAALDVLMPHPVYAPQSWVSVLNPSEATFERVKPLLAEAYSRSARGIDVRQ